MTIVETIRRTVPNDMDGQLFIQKWKEKYEEDGQSYSVKESTTGLTIEITRIHGNGFAVEGDEEE